MARGSSTHRSAIQLRIRLVLPVLLVSLVCGTAYAPAPVAATDSIPAAQAIAAAAAPATTALCGPAAPGFAACMSLRRTDMAPLAEAVVQATTPKGYGPSDLISAYALPGITSGAGAGRTVAIVDAYDLPTAASDLATYRAQYGLPPCTTSSGCFRKVNESGGTSPLPAANSGWGGEIALDIEMVSAVCPSCNVLLVEASSSLLTDLGTAVNTAASLGAIAISNSYLGSESSNETLYDSAYYTHPGVAVTASSGDTGYGVGFPAASPHVIAVGGTTLTTASNARGWTEAAWSGAGSGCSAYEPKPTWQHDSGCSKRTVADVSAVADPATGVAVYSASQGGWVVFGGTSVSSPIIASVYALAGTPAAGTYPGSYPYASPAQLNDVTSGSNGSCSGSYLCTAGTGYDGPTGLGTPNGTGAFAPAGSVTNDFNIGAAPSTLSIAQGAAGTSTIRTTLVSGSAESVALTISGLPSGVTGAFVPTSVTAGGSSTLTLTVSGSAATGTYPLTVTGTAASATHTTPVSLTVTAPATPTVTSVSPTSGPTTGGTAMTITGTGFSGATGVSFGATPAASITVTSATRISAVSPAGTGTVDITVTCPSGTSATSSADQFTYVTASTGATYVSLTPARILDTRSNTGLSGTFSSGVARTFAVAGQGGVPLDAVAVTGNLTVTGQTSAGYVSLTPAPTNNPTTSTLNFPAGDNRANGVTVALSGTGSLSATFVGSSGSATTQLIFDVTGYFVP